MTSLKKCFITAALVGLLNSHYAIAVDAYVTAEFIPDVMTPNKKEFVDTTPDTGFCSDPNTHVNCLPHERSIRTDITGEKVLDVYNEDRRFGRAISLDALPRTITLRDESTGNSVQATFRISLFGSSLTIDPSYDMQGAVLSGATNGVFNSGVYGGCTTRGSVGTERFTRYIWFFPEAKSFCYSIAGGKPPLPGQPIVKVNNVQFGYEMKILDSPLQTPNGNYTGEVTYSVGNGSDIDLNTLSMSDDSITIRIHAKVYHMFSVRFSEQQYHLTLAPKGGWGSWINGGRVPTQLSKEVPFSLSSSTAFKVSMLCDVPVGDGCGLQTQGGETVPLTTRLTMPAATTQSGSPAKDIPLTTRTSTPFGVPRFTLESLSKVNFLVEQEGVKKMVDQPGSNWKGTVSLIFDAELD
ncbi:hypothetical protein ACLBW2_06775 [Enterobacteriaceae bacterium C23F]